MDLPDASKSTATGAPPVWSGRFADYFDLAVANPRLAQLAHARIYNMIADADDHRRARQHHYDFRARHLRHRKPIEQPSVFPPAAQRLESASASSC
jgi:serine protein kinase